MITPPTITTIVTVMNILEQYSLGWWSGRPYSLCEWPLQTRMLCQYIAKLSSSPRSNQVEAELSLIPHFSGKILPHFWVRQPTVQWKFMFLEDNFRNKNVSKNEGNLKNQSYRKYEEDLKIKDKLKKKPTSQMRTNLKKKMTSNMKSTPK